MHTKPVVEQVLKEDVLFTAEVAQLLGISSSAVNNMIYRKKLIPIRSTSGAHLFYRGDIEDIINGKVSMPYLKPKEIIGHNITHKCMDYLNTLSPESFNDVVGVSIYEYEFDAVRDGYYTPEEDCYQQDSRLVATKSPSFVLHYESGNELWLKGLNCGYGGTGPNGSIAVLTEKLGVPQDFAELVYAYSVVKYSRMDDGTWVVDTHEGSPCDANRSPHIDYYVSEGHVSFDEFDRMRIHFAKQGLNGDAKAIKHFDLAKTPWHSEDEIPYGDAAATLKELKARGYHIGIIANQAAGSADRLDAWGLLEYIDVVAASAELGVSKPDRAIFERAFEMAHCTPNEAAMIGDRLDNDILPAEELGMVTVWIPNGLSLYHEPAKFHCKPDFIIENLSELMNIFE